VAIEGLEDGEGVAHGWGTSHCGGTGPCRWRPGMETKRDQ
jgi:hypothetical protein